MRCYYKWKIMFEMQGRPALLSGLFRTKVTETGAQFSSAQLLFYISLSNNFHIDFNLNLNLHLKL